jgi:hypothetical protein
MGEAATDDHDGGLVHFAGCDCADKGFHMIDG